MASVRDVVGSRPVHVAVPWVAAESLQEAQGFVAEEGDVLIVTYPKTGTTWAQQLCHQLRTGGHTDFDEISEVVPWLEIAPAIGQALAAPQLAAPRCFKTHQPLSAWGHLAAARFLCIVRDPEAALISEFKQKIAKANPAAAARDVNAFARQRIWLGDDAAAEGVVPLQFGATIWEFYVEMWRCRHLPQVRVVPYESMKSDLAAVLPVVAALLGLPLPTDEARARVLELCSFRWMSVNTTLFDDHHIITRLKGLGRSTDGFLASSKVGLQVEDGVNLVVSNETRALLQRKWQNIVTPATGLASYSDMVSEYEHDIAAGTAAL